jgi:hypothetical protein
MLIKVACTCGQHYEFEVEPVNGAMPCNVVCPSCSADGTQAANQYIAQQSASAAPVPPAPVPIAPPPPSGLRISRPAASPAEPEPLSAPAGTAPAPAPAPIQKRYTRALDPEREPPKTEPNILMGLLGGVVAGAIAMAGWYFLTLATERQFGYVACVVGAFVGIGVRTLAKHGDQKLGFIASVCAALAILGGNFLVVNHFFNMAEKELGGLADVLAEQRQIAKQAVDAKSDDEIKAWLVKNGELDHAPTQEDIKEFKDSTLPAMRTMLESTDNGKASKLAKRSEMFSFSTRFQFFKENMSVLQYLFLAFGVVAAWRIGCGSD